MILRLRQSGELFCDQTSQNLKFFLENISLKKQMDGLGCYQHSARYLHTVVKGRGDATQRGAWPYPNF